MTWPMLEKLAVARLNAELGVQVAGTRLPGDVESRPQGFIRVTRGPGGDDGITDSPLLDVEAFHPDQAEAWSLAERARQALLGMRGRADAGHLIDTVETATGPNRVEYSPNLERYVAAYRVSYRR